MTTIMWIVGGAVIAIGIAMCLGIYLGYKIILQIQEEVAKNPIVELPPPPQVNVNMRPMEEAIKGIPNKVLHSIQSSINTKKGTLGELIGYIKLEAKYDRIIPLGNIVDFMCIKFPVDENEGRVDFVDIKTGKSSRLSKEQRLLQQLIKDKKVNFVKMNVNTQTSENINKTD